MKTSPSAEGNKSKKQRLVIPKFESEAEEAAWWEAHADYMLERARKFRHVAQLLKLIRTTPVSLRIDQDVLDEATTIAKKRHLPYQRVLKDAMRSSSNV